MVKLIPLTKPPLACCAFQICDACLITVHYAVDALLHPQTERLLPDM
jgi:hypothetical protein